MQKQNPRAKSEKEVNKSIDPDTSENEKKPQGTDKDAERSKQPENNGSTRDRS